MSLAQIIDIRRQTIAAPRNPMDVCTVVSIFPKDIHEVKHTIQPGVFDVLAGSYEKPSVLVVGSSSWWKEIDEEQPLLEIPNSSIQVANSIITDYCNGLLACSMGLAMPGLFYVPGRFDVAGIKKEHSALLDKAKVMQDAWYEALVELADGFWARTNANPLSIDHTMRMAAEKLGRKDKDWMQDFTAKSHIPCVACGAMRNPEFPICGSCHNVIDKVKAKSLGIAFTE